MRFQITGYLTNNIGLIETSDATFPGVTMVVFHTSDLYLFQKKAQAVEEPIDDVIPPGLKVQ